MMKKIFLITAFAFAGMAVFAGKGKKLPVKKVAAKQVSPKSYPVTGMLSCGVHFTFHSNCSSSMYWCMQQWSAEFAEASSMFCQ